MLALFLLLGGFLRSLLHLLLLRAGFNTSWNAPGPILEGPGKVLERPSAFISSLLVRRYVRSTSAASRRDAKRARFKVQVPNIASKAFLSLKSLALKAYLKVRLEISDLGRLPPSLNPSPRPARTAKNHLKNYPRPPDANFFRFLALSSCTPILTSTKKK